MKNSRLLFAAVFFFQAAVGQSWQDTLSLIDKALSQYQPGNPGCQLSVARNGQLIFSKAWGMADLERNVALSTNSILEAGSVSKQFTAAAILLLEQQGKLSLDDDVRKYTPELPDYGTPIRLRQMLHHTSGLRDWGSVTALAGWPRGKKFYSNEDALEIIARQKDLNNKPGAEYIYSNSNYNLFAIIVQRVSGLSLAAFTRKYIFEPAGMLHTQWRDDPNRIVPNRAIAYTKSGVGFETEMPNEYVYGNGGLLTTTEDLLQWTRFYQQASLGGPALLSKQIHTDPLNNGVMNPYAAGLMIKTTRGWSNISHSGATAGYRAYLETFPELNLSIALLSNTSQFNIVGLANQVDKIFVPDKIQTAAIAESSIHLADAALNSFAGMYRNERDGSVFTLSVKDRQLQLDSTVMLAAVAGNIFKTDNFLFIINGNKGLYIPFSPSDSIPFTKVSPVHFSKGDMDSYTGKYFSAETNSSIIIQHDKDGLLLQLKPGETYPLKPTYKDAFTIEAMGCDLQFTRAAGNKMLAMKMSVSRARNVLFTKIK